MIKMAGTNVIKKIDDLGRIAIPKDMCMQLGWKEGDSFELHMDKANKMITFKKYIVNSENIAEHCAKYVEEHRFKIYGVMTDMTENTAVNINGTMYTVKKNPKDKFDLNIAICVAFYKANFRIGNPVTEMYLNY